MVKEKYYILIWKIKEVIITNNFLIPLDFSLSSQ